MAPHSSTLAWKIPWMEGPGGLAEILDTTVRGQGCGSSEAGPPRPLLGTPFSC